MSGASRTYLDIVLQDIFKRVDDDAPEIRSLAAEQQKREPNPPMNSHESH